MASPGLRASRAGGRSDAPKVHVRDTLPRNSSASESRNEPASISRRPAGRKRSFTVKQARVSKKKSRDAHRDDQTKPSVLRRINSVPKMPSGKVLSKHPNRGADLRQNSSKESMTRSMTDSAIYGHGVSSRSLLLQLFNIFQRNAPEPPARMLVSVTMLGSIREVRLIVRGHETVRDVTKAALAAYAKEGRMLPQGCDAEDYELHSSQFSLQSLHSEDTVMNSGARSFVLCRKRDDQLQNEEASKNQAAGKEGKRRWWNVLGLAST